MDASRRELCDILSRVYGTNDRITTLLQRIGIGAADIPFSETARLTWDKVDTLLESAGLHSKLILEVERDATAQAHCSALQVLKPSFEVLTRVTPSDSTRASANSEHLVSDALASLACDCLMGKPHCSTPRDPVPTEAACRKAPVDQLRYAIALSTQAKRRCRLGIWETVGIVVAIAGLVLFSCVADTTMCPEQSNYAIIAFVGLLIVAASIVSLRILTWGRRDQILDKLHSTRQALARGDRGHWIERDFILKMSTNVW